MQPIIYTLAPLSWDESDQITRALRRGLSQKLTLTQNYLLVRLQTLMTEGYTSVSREEMASAWGVCTKTIAQVLPTLAPYVQCQHFTLRFDLDAFKEEDEAPQQVEPKCATNTTGTDRLTSHDGSCVSEQRNTIRPTGKPRTVLPGKIHWEPRSQCPATLVSATETEHREPQSTWPNSRNQGDQESHSLSHLEHRECDSQYPERESRSLAYTGAHVSTPSRALGVPASLSRVPAHAVEDLLSSSQETFSGKREDPRESASGLAAREGGVSPSLQSLGDTCGRSSSFARTHTRGARTREGHRESGVELRQSAITSRAWQNDTGWAQGAVATQPISLQSERAQEAQEPHRLPSMMQPDKMGMLKALETCEMGLGLVQMRGVHRPGSICGYTVGLCVKAGLCLPQQSQYVIGRVWQETKEGVEDGRITEPAAFFVAKLKDFLGLDRFGAQAA